jgi:Cu+-exporting ATPase
VATDPVCGMDVDEAQPPATTEFEGRTYYFCSDSCREEFEANPERYALASDTGDSPVA